MYLSLNAKSVNNPLSCSNKGRFPKQRKSKLNIRGDGPFQVLQHINDNVYR